MLEFPPDVTALYQIALFVALWFALKRLVFDPMLANLANRQRRTRGALEEVERLRAETERLRADRERFLVEIRREGGRLRDEIRRQAASEERELLERAREESDKILADVRARVASEVEQARAALERETGALSERIVQTVLGGKS